MIQHPPSTLMQLSIYLTTAVIKSDFERRAVTRSRRDVVMSSNFASLSTPDRQILKASSSDPHSVVVSVLQTPVDFQNARFSFGGLSRKVAIPLFLIFAIAI